MTTAWVFPGQGSQEVSMGADLYQRYEVAKQTFHTVEEATGVNLRTLCFEGPDEELKQTQNAQLAIFTVSLASLLAYRETSDIQPAFVAGHSLGEYTALVAAEALDLASAAQLVATRGRLMRQAGLTQPGTMAAIMGLDPQVLADVCARCKELVVVANHNTAEQLVISGTPAGVEEACALAKESGAKKAIPLQVSGAFHSPLMEPAAEELYVALKAAPWKDAKIPVVSNCDATPTILAAEFPQKLYQQLTHPVLWERSIRWMLSKGVDTVMEFGRGKVLSGMLKRIERSVVAQSQEVPVGGAE